MSLETDDNSGNLFDSEVIRFDIRSKERFIACGLRSTDVDVLRAFFERFGVLSECRTSVSNGVVYGFVAFHSQTTTELVKRDLRYAVIDQVRVRVLCVERDRKDRHRTLPLHKMIDIANAYFGPTGWTSELLSCELVADTVRQVEFTGDEDSAGNAGVKAEPTPAVPGAAATQPAPGGVRKALQATFRAVARISWDPQKVITMDPARHFVDGMAEKLVVQPTTELCFDLGLKSAASDALKAAFSQIALAVLFNEDRSFDVAVHFADESAEAWCVEP
jgi:hypothetical protein